MLNQKLPTKTKIASRIYFIFFLAVYFIVLIYLANKVFIWEDESYSLHTSANNLSKVISLAYTFEGQPPFYFVLLALWRLINPTIFFARLLSIIFIGGSAFYFNKLIKLFTIKRNNKWPVVVFLLNPFTVWAALEIRLYALVILLSTILIYYFLRYFSDGRKKDLVILLGLAVIGLYTQYFFGFLITSFAATLLWFKGKNRFMQFCLFCIPVAILFLPNFIFLPDQLSMAQTHLNVNVAHVFDVLRTPQDFLLSLNTVPLPQYVRWLIKIPILLFFLLAFFKLITQKSSFEGSYLQLLKVVFLILFLCLLLYIIFVPLLSLIFQEKYMIVTFSTFILLYSLWQVLPWQKIAYILISVYFICLLALKYQYPEKTYNFRQVANFIEKVELNNEPILFYGKSIVPPFQYYYKGKAHLFPLPPINYDKDYYEERITDTTDLIRQIESIKYQSNSFLLVTESITGFKYKQSLTKTLIEKALYNRYSILFDTTFYSRNSDNYLRVQRLKRKQ
ncbi:MAG: hypothetical protein ACTHJN_16315 [Ginsengibacter sp.]